jgi:hypothetical protein
LINLKLIMDCSKIEIGKVHLGNSAGLGLADTAGA